ncbi:MAG: TRAP transporter substrate-binding protein DctP [Deltaproteobacteria bacterium]|nr:TRAP transporter substrate-binding protein DctP [Deltaproteobacteria bacterium]
MASGRIFVRGSRARRIAATALVASFGALAAVVGHGAVAQTPPAPQPTVIRIATLAPRGSSWMRVFNAWDRTLKQRTNKQLSLRFYPGGVQGDERDVVRKMGNGQLDGGAITSVGLGQIVRPVLVLQVPGLFRRYQDIDYVRERLTQELSAQFEQAGYKFLGWGDVGMARVFSNRPITRPSDFRNVRPWVWRDDPISQAFMEVVGATPVRLGVPEVLPSMQTRIIDTVTASALAAVQLQWAGRVTHVTQQSDTVLVGATVMRKSVFDALPADMQTALMETSAQAHATLVRTIRREDDAAFTTLRGRLTVTDLTSTQAEWERAAQQTRQRLAGRLYPPALLSRVETLAAEARRR